MFSYLRSFIELIYPNLCVVCEKSLVEGENEVCLGCLAKCEETYFHLQARDNEVFYRFSTPINITAGSAFYYFEQGGVVQQVIHSFKYENRYPIGKYLGMLYGNILKNSRIIADIQAIIPIPLHRHKEFERGYNQSEIFAKGLGKALNCKVLGNGLTRTRNTKSQTELNHEERRANVANVFKINTKPPEIVLLVDDVITTGATLESAAEVLSKNGVKDIRVICLASVRV